MVKIGSGAKRKQVDYELSRYACYLIVQNSDPRKEIVSLGQTYFAVQTRKQELIEEEYDNLTEDEKRFYQRNLTRKGNYSLNIAAKNAGVKNLINFIMLDIEDYIMESQLMILLEERNLDIGKIF